MLHRGKLYATDRTTTLKAPEGLSGNMYALQSENMFLGEDTLSAIYVLACVCFKRCSCVEDERNIGMPASDGLAIVTRIASSVISKHSWSKERYVGVIIYIFVHTIAPICL